MSHTTLAKRSLQAAITALIVVLLVGCILLYFKFRKPLPRDIAIDQTFGLQKIAGVDESGFYNSEMGQSPPIPFRWTNGSAQLSIPFSMPPPVALHVRLGLTVPRPTRLDLRINGTSLFNEKINPQTEWVRTIPLAGLNLSSPLNLEIISGTFHPSKEKEGVEDNRQLGIRIHGIKLLRELPDVTGLNLVAEMPPGVDESGFHNLEKCEDQPCRWTDGAAKLTIPAGPHSQWKKIVVAAQIPDRPNWRVKVTINGKSLFDEEVRSGAIWTKELPIDIFDPNRPTTIELSSSSIDPGTLKSKDGRRLGIRVRKLMFISD